VDAAETSVSVLVDRGVLSDRRLDRVSEVWLESTSAPPLEEEDEGDVEVSRLVVAGEFSDI
jgi:hypothetical protein